jgi:hypothetical protein
MGGSQHPPCRTSRACRRRRGELYSGHDPVRRVDALVRFPFARACFEARRGVLIESHTNPVARTQSPPPPRTHAHICKHTHAHRGKRTAILFQGELQSSFPRCLLWVMVLGRVCHSPSARYGAPAHLTAQVEDGDGPHTVEDCAAARPPFGLDQRRHALQPAPSCRHPRWRKFTFRASNEEPQG